jgi:hypothetical protein
MIWSVVTAALLLVAGAVAAGFSGCLGASFTGDLEQSRPALARVEPLHDAPTPPLSRRVILAIVDGLRYDASQQMPYVNTLRARGVAAMASSQYPTFSRPNYVNLLTGVPPEFSGVRTNMHPTTVKLDSLMTRVRANGGHAGYASDYDSMPRMFLRSTDPGPVEPLDAIDINALLEGGEPEAQAVSDAVMADAHSEFDDVRYAPWPGGFRDSAERLIAGTDELVVLLIGVVDAAGHAYGGDSPEYAEAVQRADSTLERVLKGVDLTQETVLIVADHGHTDWGGHGGLERQAVEVPLVMVGAGVRPGGVVEDALLQDVAPTIARLLGVPPPGHALGRSLVSALAFDDVTRRTAEKQDLLRIARNQTVVARAIYQARQERLELRALRLGLLVVGGALLIALAWWLRRMGGLRFDWKSLAVGVPAFFVVYYILIAVLGQRFSPSFLPARGQITSELLKWGIAATLAQIAAGWWALRRTISLPDRLAKASGIALVGMIVAMIPVALSWALFPPPYVEVPSPTLMVLIPAVEISVACYAGGIAVSLFMEVVVFFARAVDPRVRVARLEKALERTRSLAEGVDSTGEPERRRERRQRMSRRPRRDPSVEPPPGATDA